MPGDTSVAATADGRDPSACHKHAKCINELLTF